LPGDILKQRNQPMRSISFHGSALERIIIGTAALILMLGVFNGLEGLVKSLYSSFYSEINISASRGKTITVTNEQFAKTKGTWWDKKFSLVTEEKGLLKNGNYQSAVVLKGVDENYKYVAGVADHLIRGNYNLGTEDDPFIILGAGVENAVGRVN
jgi:lipoprotein-releasing system permease protein